jgi:hypothetical protein
VARGDASAIPHRERVWSRGTRGDIGTLLCWGGMPGATGHVAVSELSDSGSGSRAAETRDDTRTLSYRVWSLAFVRLDLNLTHG